MSRSDAPDRGHALQRPHCGVLPAVRGAGMLELAIDGAARECIESRSRCNRSPKSRGLSARRACRRSEQIAARDGGHAPRPFATRDDSLSWHNAPASSPASRIRAALRAACRSEPFTAIEQICHVRDIEIEGYQVRFKRTLDEHSPLLPSIDSEAVAKERNYGGADSAQVFAEFRAARAQDPEPAARPRRFAVRASGGVRRLWPGDTARAGSLPVQPRSAAPVGPAMVVRQDRRREPAHVKRAMLLDGRRRSMLAAVSFARFELVSRHGWARPHPRRHDRGAGVGARGLSGHRTQDSPRANAGTCDITAADPISIS